MATSPAPGCGKRGPSSITSDDGGPHSLQTHHRIACIAAAVVLLGLLLRTMRPDKAEDKRQEVRISNEDGKVEG